MSKLSFKLPTFICFLCIAIGLMFVLYIIIPYISRKSGIEGFYASSIVRHVIGKTSSDEQPPYGYENDPNDENSFRSIFFLKQMPDNGKAPYGYERSTDGKYIIPISSDAIYASVAESSTAIVGSDTIKIDLVIRYDTEQDALAKNEVINTLFESGNNWNKANVRWNITNSNNISFNNSDEFFQNIDGIRNATYNNNKAITDANKGKVHLFLYIKEGEERIDYDIQKGKTPIVIFGTNKKSPDDNGFRLKLTQVLCKVLGLDSTTSTSNTNNIMYEFETDITDQEIYSRELTPSQAQIIRNSATVLPNNLNNRNQINTSDEKSEELLGVLKSLEERISEYKNDYYGDIEYHESEDEIRARMSDDVDGIAYVIDKDGKRIGLGKIGTQPNQLYHTAGSYPFGSANYVPKYDDSVYLSKLTGETTAKPLEDTAAMKGGFCTQEKHSPVAIDTMCQTMDKDKCASTSCCVLLGGAKCVGGNEKGPTMNGHYKDVTIQNRDYYYYQGKCHGNCPENNPF